MAETTVKTAAELRAEVERMMAALQANTTLLAELEVAEAAAAEAAVTARIGAYVDALKALAAAENTALPPGRALVAYLGPDGTLAHSVFPVGESTAIAAVFTAAGPVGFDAREGMDAAGWFAAAAAWKRPKPRTSRSTEAAAAGSTARDKFVIPENKSLYILSADRKNTLGPLSLCGAAAALGLTHYCKKHVGPEGKPTGDSAGRAILKAKESNADIADRIVLT